MKFSKQNFKMIFSCLLLFVFLFKLSSTVFGFQKVPKIIVALADDNDENQDGSEKKDDLKSNFNLNKDFNFPVVDHTCVFFCLINEKLHPDHQHCYHADHFPAVLMPPPNC